MAQKQNNFYSCVLKTAFIGMLGLAVLGGNYKSYGHILSTPNFSEIANPANNTLTRAEKKQGWQLLFDGKTTNGWRGAHKDAFPEQGWKIANGELQTLETGGRESRNGGDIVTKDEYSNFELVLEVKLTAGANSGIKYFVTEKEPPHPGSAIGLEFQILDDSKHPDAKMGKNGNRTIGSLYDLITAQNKKTVPISEWNKVRILSKGRHVEHWLNGVKVVEYERGSPAFKAIVAQSKYKDYPNFGEADKGRILLQEHGNAVAYRNVKIRQL